MSNQTYEGASRQYPVNSHQLWIRQQPEKSRVVVKGREKEKKPIDPPPILQLNILNDASFIHNPYLFCGVELWHATGDSPATNQDSVPVGPDAADEQLLVGQTVSSLHRLKDLDGAEKGFFVFGDLAVNIMGRFRLRFSLWEYSITAGAATFLKDCYSNLFEVASAKEWDGVKESTALSRAIADQGIKLRLRKESRHPNKRGATQPSNGPVSSASTPLRPAGSSYSQDTVGGTSEPPSKRQRSFGAESGSGPSPVSSTSYSTYTASPQGPPYAGYPPTSAGQTQSTYYSQQPYNTAYPPSSYTYPQYGQQPAYASTYRAPPPQQPPQQPESTSSYPAPTNYSGSSYPYHGTYPPPSTQGGYTYPAGPAQRGSMADPANPPRLAPISNYDSKPSQYSQQPEQSQGQRGTSYDWNAQGQGSGQPR